MMVCMNTHVGRGGGEGKGPSCKFVREDDSMQTEHSHARTCPWGERGTAVDLVDLA